MSDGFGPLLQALVERVPGALGAIFTDWEGEPVGSFGTALADSDLEIIGAQWTLVWTQLQRSLERVRLGAPHELVIDSARARVIIRQVSAEYCLVLAAQRGTHLAIAQRELERTAVSLRAQM